MTSAVVILSGGQDSTTALFWAKQHYRMIHTLSFDYGQRHHRELISAHQVSVFANAASHEQIHLGDILHSTSPLTDRTAQLETYENFEQMDKVIGERVELTFVPMRNLLFLTVAANRAVAKGATVLVTGICQEDNANYPDCRASFAHHAEGVINLALGNTWGKQGWISVSTPLMNKTKAQTVLLAKDLPGCLDALAYSHTCYAGRFPPCGECHACVLRAHGFAEAGVPDPLIARAQREMAEMPF